MSGTIYSYKPVGGGLEGASTVVVLKTGQLLELRRGEKTKWRRGEERQRWATVEEWRASLPAGAVVTESAPMYATAVEASSDFQAIVTVTRKLKSSLPSHSVSISSNAADAARIGRVARRLEKYRDRLARNTWAGNSSQLAWMAAVAREKREEAAAILAKPAYSRHFCRKRLAWDLQIQREDGVFVPLLVDKSRHLLHIPVLDGVACKRGHDVDRVGATVAELGVRPVLLLRTPVGTRMMTLEEVVAAAE